MKALGRSSLALLVGVLLVGCGEGKDEETIRITIEKGGQKVTAEPAAPPTPRQRTAEVATPVRETAGARGEDATPRTAGQPAIPRDAPETAGQQIEEGPPFASVAGRLDVTANGRDGAKRNWGALKGATVTWSGTVHEVDLGRRGFKLYVRANNPAPAKRYNIVVGGNGQLSAAGALRPGQEVRFSGTIHRADYGRTPGEVIVVLADGRIR